MPKPSADTAYIGRFAPSPTGPLHQGSLLCALASFLAARSCKGQWLLRIEDLDPPREQAGAGQLIRQSLLAHGMQWDGEVMYQSQRLRYYRHALRSLAQRGLVYRCTCSRADLGSGPYSGHCRNAEHPEYSEHAIRLRTEVQTIRFDDALQGEISENLADTCGDFVIRRKDGLFSYQLAVTVDDAAQGITHVVRGVDLIDSTARQIYLMRLMQQAVPEYAHIPILVDARGNKLSKQTGAVAIDDTQATVNLMRALQTLGQEQPPAAKAGNVKDIIDFAIKHYQVARIPRRRTITA